MRLINADYLLNSKEYGDLSEVRICDDERGEYINTFKEIVDSAPTIDAMPIVRCKDCKWWADVDGATKKFGLGACCCGNKVMRLGFLTQKDWYCADGEREDDETD